MPSRVYPIENNFTAGKLSSMMYSRYGTKWYANGLKQCENAIVLPHGGVSARGCFKCVIEDTSDDGSSLTYVKTKTTGASNTVRLIPFVFNNNPENSYMLEFGNLYTRFMKYDTARGGYAQIWTGSGSAYEITTVYETSNLQNLRYVQSADVLYLVDGNHAPYKLIRKGDTDWEISVLPLNGEPFLADSGFVYYDALTDTEHTTEVINDYNTFQAAFDYKAQGYTFIRKLSGAGNSFPINTTYGISFGLGYVNRPDFLEDYSTNNVIENDNLYLSLRGNIFVPVQDQYYFALNAEPAYDFTFGIERRLLFNEASDVVANGKDNRNEFAFKRTGSNVDVERFAKYVDRNDNWETLTVGTYPFELRLAEALPDENFACVLAWRDGGELTHNGTGTSTDLTLPFLEVKGTYTLSDSSVIYGINHEVDYYGNRCFQIRFWIDSLDNTKFGWAYREETDMNEYTAWVAIVGGINADGSPQAGNGTIALTNFNDTVSGQANCYQFVDESGGGSGAFEGAGLLSTAYFGGASSGTAGAYWTWKVGFIPIKGEYFQRTTESATTEYPRTVTIHENRLVFGGTDNLPTAIWGSKSGDFEDFNLRQIPNADDAFRYTISGQQVDIIQWLKSTRELLVGTQSAEYVVRGQDGFISAADPPLIRANTFYGGAFVDPVLINNSVVFVEKSKKRINNYYYRFGIDGYEADDDSIIAYEELENKVREMAFQRAGDVCLRRSTTGDPPESTTFDIYHPPVNLLWVVTETGELKAVTYDKKQEVIAWHEHKINEGNFTIEQVATLPGPEGHEDVYVVVYDDSDHSRYICYLDANNNQDMSGLDTTYSFRCQVETMPMEVGLGEGQSSQGLVKSWASLYMQIFGSRNIEVSRGSVIFQDYLQVVSESTGQAPAHKQIWLHGYDTQMSLLFKNTQLIDGDVKYVQPMTVLSVYGKLLVSEP